MSLTLTTQQLIHALFLDNKAYSFVAPTAEASFTENGLFDADGCFIHGQAFHQDFAEEEYDSEDYALIESEVYSYLQAKFVEGEGIYRWNEGKEPSDKADLVAVKTADGWELV